MINKSTDTSKKKNILEYFTNGCIQLFEKYLPDPLVLVVLITFLVFGAGILFEEKSPVVMLTYWMDSFWSLNGFAMQMTLILVTGFIVATTPLFSRFVHFFAGMARTPGRAIIIVTLISIVASLINWGIGLVLGAVLSKQLAKRVAGVDYRLLVASAYSGLLFWHGGLSGSVPLILATPGNFLEKSIGIISTNDTLFSTLNLSIIAALLVVLPLTNFFLMRSIEKPVTFNQSNASESDETSKSTLPVSSNLAKRMEHSPWLAYAIALLGFAAIATYVANGGGLNINIIISVFLFTGIALHSSLNKFLKSLNDGIKGASGVLIQFPFYAGLMGMMKASGLAASIAQVFVDMSTVETLPIISFLSAGLINIFIPSGGGQWSVQGPILIEAAQSLHADIPQVAMAFAWGDAWTNMIQPFWALPTLAICGLKARDIMGFCSLILLITGAVICTILVFI